MRKLRDLFGPWPIRPVALSVLLSLFQLLVNSAVVIATAREAGRFASLRDIAATVPSVILGFTLALSSLWISKSLTDRYGKWAALIYWLGAISFGVSLATARILSINDSTPEFWQDQAAWWRIFFAAILVYVTVHVSLGLANKKLAEQVVAAEAAKKALEIQRRRLISAQEDVRRQIADFLHDRLQSDLVLLGIQMQRSSEKLGDEEKAIARAYVDEIERIRQFDVRSVSRQLAPELDGPSMQPALDELLARYEKIFSHSLKISESGNLTRELKLACYRIVEQALLNSATHAKSTEVRVWIEESQSEVLVEVQNNGVALARNLSAGAGFAIYDDWTKSHNGSWELSSSGGWTVLKATLSK